MKTTDHAPLVAIAMLAARADGAARPEEQAAIDAVVARIGVEDISVLAEQVVAGQVRAADLVVRLSDDEARRTAWEAALAVCHADGAPNAAEQAFLDELRGALGLSDAAAAEPARTAGALARVPVTAGAAGGAPPAGTLDDFILEQAILTGAIEVLPDSLANIAVVPLQLRMVYQIGQRHGRKLDAAQVKDLAATLGLGIAAQAVEGVVMKVLGGVAGGLLGGLVGGAARVAAGAAVTFAATYALGHVADEYYARGRSLGRDDLRALYARFQQDAKTLYPKVQERIRNRSGSLDIQSLLDSLRGSPA